LSKKGRSTPHKFIAASTLRKGKYKGLQQDRKKKKKKKKIKKKKKKKRKKKKSNHRGTY